jgi:hypothetical protein
MGSVGTAQSEVMKNVKFLSGHNGTHYTISKSKMISRWQGGGSAGGLRKPTTLLTKIAL